MVRTTLAFLSVLVGYAAGHTQTAPTVPTDAAYAVIMDHETGATLFSKQGDVPMIPASMTKIMTAYLVFDRLERGEIALTDQFTVSENAWRQGGWASGGSTMGLAVGDQPTVEELLRGVIVLSGNDACIVLAEGLSGSESNFAFEMTELAQELGLNTASFVNATGLDAPEHRISAVDLAKLSNLTIERFPQFYEFYSEASYEWRGISQPNRNPILGRMDGVDGLKTGHLSASGYGLVASAKRDGVRRTIVINGLESMSARAAEAERLMRVAFTSFETRTILPEEVQLPELPVWLGEKRTLSVSLAKPITVSAHRRAFSYAVTELSYDQQLAAPIEAGAEVGRLIVTIDGAEEVSAPVVANENIVKLGFFGRAIEGLSLKISGSEG